MCSDHLHFGNSVFTAAGSEKRKEAYEFEVNAFCERKERKKRWKRKKKKEKEKGGGHSHTLTNQPPPPDHLTIALYSM